MSIDPVAARLVGREHGDRRHLLPSSLNPDGAAKFGFSYGIRTGNIVWMAGQIARDRHGNLVGQGDIEAQSVQVFENLKAVVQEAGGSMDDIVRTTTYITDRAYRETVVEVSKRYFRPPNLPTSVLLIISGLGSPEYLVEVDAVAVLRN